MALSVCYSSAFLSRELGSLTAGLTLECSLFSDLSSVVWLRCFGNLFLFFLFISPFTTCPVRLFVTQASLYYFLADPFGLYNGRSARPSLLCCVYIQLIAQAVKQMVGMPWP